MNIFTRSNEYFNCIVQLSDKLFSIFYSDYHVLNTDDFLISLDEMISIRTYVNL